MQDFVAIDFETANNNRASACEVAVIRFSQGKPTDQFATLLRPPQDLGGFTNTRTHRLTSSDCENSPTFSEVFPTITDFIGNMPVVCHSSGFDFSVWRHLLAYFGLNHAPITYGCTWA